MAAKDNLSRLRPRRPAKAPIWIIARHDVEIIERPVEAIQLRPLEIAISVA